MIERATTAGPVGFMAFHAGLESGTLEIASTAATACGASLYTVDQPPALRWHVPSTEVDPAGSAILAAWMSHVRKVVAVHGYGRHDRPWDVLVGGVDASLRHDVAGAIRSAAPSLRVVDDPAAIPAGLRGRHPANPVNTAADGGVQVELPVRVRRGPLGATVAAALADVARRWAAAG